MTQYHETILVVEDDVQIRNFIVFALKSEGFSCITAGNAQTALKKLVSEQIDMVLLDLGLPDVDGMEVIRKVREWSELPILVVSARDQDKEKAAALDAGADDYLTKPFSATELLARIRVALRHLYRSALPKTQAVCQVGELVLDMEKHAAFMEEQPLHLTPMEFSLMSLFMKNPGKVLTTSYIIREIWGNGYGTDTQALRTLMAGLRRKVEKTPANPQYLFTEVGVGYRLRDV
ncbi:response regulator transcription factor [Blautia schinkii]|nr:response regulator transcription factor [Blautia schinkii]